MQTIKNRIVGVLAACLLPQLVLAQFQIGGHVGVDFDATDLYVGPHVVFDLPVTVGDDLLKLNPEFSYYLADSDVPGVNASFWLLSATALYPLGFDFAESYFGAGLVIARSSYSVDADASGAANQSGSTEVSDSSTDFGLNLKGGVEFGEGGARPFGEGGIVISDQTWLFAQGGVRFTFGQ